MGYTNNRIKSWIQTSEKREMCAYHELIVHSVHPKTFKRRNDNFYFEKRWHFPEVHVSVASQLTNVVPLLRVRCQLTDVCCLGEIKTPARSEISSSAMSAGTPRSLASSGQKSIQDICHPLSAEESALSRSPDVLNPSGAGEKVRSALCRNTSAVLGQHWYVWATWA